MTETKSVKTLKKQLGAAIAMVLVAAVALGSSTYAWFVNNTKVTADNVTVTAKAANTLLISHADENAWGTTAKFKAETATEFVPVSTIDAKKFYKDKNWATETEEGEQKGEYTAVEFQDAAADTDYFTDTFQIKSSQNCGLYLDTDTQFTTTDNANVLKSMRLALVVEGGKTFFYQVDAEPISGNGNSYNTTLTTLTADGIKKAINGTTTASKITANNLSSGDVIALSAGSVAAPTDNTTLVNKDDTKKLCDLTANTAQKITVYIWMEGCDYDCNTVVVKQITEQAVKCVLGFVAGKTA